MYTDELFMKRCLELAGVAKKSGRTAVGSVLVRDDQIVAEGIEGEQPLPALLAHAEVVAIVKATEILATRDLSGCTLYTTVEPCFMCSYLIRETKVSKVVFGTQAGEIGGFQSAYPILSDTDIKKWSGVAVKGDCMETECSQMLRKIVTN